MSSPIHKDQEATLVSTQGDLDKALPVDSSESGSSAGTTFVPDADEAIMSAAFVSMQDRRSRLTSLLHHLTVDPEAPDQELPIAGLPAEERSRDAGAVTRRARTGWQSARLFVVTGVTAALIGLSMALLPGARKAGTETVQAESPPPPVATKLQVQSATEVPPLIHDSLPQESAEPSGTANAATEVPPLIHDSLPQESAEPSGTANAATEVPPLIHDSLPQESAELSGAAKAATRVPDSLPQQNTEPSFAANVQPATGVPPRVHDSRAQDDIPPLPAAETSHQAPKPQLQQSVGSSQVLDADEIAALVKRGKDFVNDGDLISARLLLRRAAEAGSADAALALGETFDPVVFQRLHVIGIEPDAARAQKWYQRAAELGSAAASQHFAKPPSSPLNDEAKKTEIPPSSQLNDEAKKTEIPQSSQFNDEAKKTEIPPSSQLNDEFVIKKAQATIAAKMSDPNSVEFENIERAARNNALGNSIEAVCGIVRDKNSGPRRFLYLVQTNEAYIGGYAVASSEYRNICSGK